MPARTTCLAAASVMFPVLLLVACGHAAAPAPPPPPPVTLSFCGGNPQPMPSVIEVVCNTDDITARNLVWTAWGKSVATARGTAVVDQCAYEDCATGAYSSVPIKLVASNVADCPKAGRAYETLRYVFPDGSPWPDLPANLNTSGYMAAPDRDLPPKNQTVSLSCG
jgi:hypothetical protein